MRRLRAGGALLNGKSAGVSATAALADSLIFFSRGSDRQGWRSTAVLDALAPRVAEWKKLGSAALEACLVACGEGDGCVLNAINPWDIAAGALMVEEAGGGVTDFYGKPWKGGKEFLVLSNGLLQPELVNLTKNALGPGSERF